MALGAGHDLCRYVPPARGNIRGETWTKVINKPCGIRWPRATLGAIADRPGIVAIGRMMSEAEAAANALAAVLLPRREHRLSALQHLVRPPLEIAVPASSIAELRSPGRPRDADHRHGFWPRALARHASS